MTNLISGLVTVATAGTAVVGTSTDIVPGWYAFSASAANTGTYVYIGNDGADDVAATTGFSLGKTDIVYLYISDNLAEIYFDVDTSGDTIDFIRVASPGFGPTA